MVQYGKINVRVKLKEGKIMGKVIKLVNRKPKIVKDLSKIEIQESQKRLLYDDDKYLQKVYQEILKEM